MILALQCLLALFKKSSDYFTLFLRVILEFSNTNYAYKLLLLEKSKVEKMQRALRLDVFILSYTHKNVQRTKKTNFE